MRPPLVLGFDPGREGGWAVTDGTFWNAGLLPLAGKLIHLKGLMDTVELEWGVPDLVVIERQWGRSTDTATTLNYLLPQYGQLVGGVQVAGWPLLTPGPKDWKRVVLAGTARDKEAAIEYVAKRFPTVDMFPGRRRKAADGIADAVCIADWGLRQLQKRPIWDSHTPW